ncbi:MAG: hypothetical protein R2843_01380 [Thermomicrobiales bacterium]
MPRSPSFRSGGPPVIWKLRRSRLLVVSGCLEHVPRRHRSVGKFGVAGLFCEGERVREQDATRQDDGPVGSDHTAVGCDPLHQILDTKRPRAERIEEGRAQPARKRRNKRRCGDQARDRMIYGSDARQSPLTRLHTLRFGTPVPIPGGFEGNHVVGRATAQMCIGGREREEPSCAEEESRRSGTTVIVAGNGALEVGEGKERGEFSHRLAIFADAEDIEDRRPQHLIGRDLGQFSFEGSDPGRKARISERPKYLDDLVRSLSGDLGGTDLAADPAPVGARCVVTRSFESDRADRHDASIATPGFGAVIDSHDVENDLVVGGILMMTVRAPTAGAKVEFDGAGFETPIRPRDHGVAKVGPESVRPDAPVNDFDVDTVACREPVWKRSVRPGMRQGQFAQRGIWLGDALHGWSGIGGGSACGDRFPR